MPDANHLSAYVTILAALFYFYTLILVARMRQKHGVKAPAVTGAPEFERAYRVQMNTLEAMPLFLPFLWLATIYFGGWIPAALGLAWVAGRIAYMQGYMKAAELRGPGFGIQSLAQFGLLGLAVIGLIR